MNKNELTNLAAQLENSRIQSMLNADVDRLNELFSDDLYYGHTGGYVDNKAEFLEKISSGVYRYSAIENQIDNVMAIGESGLTINGKLTIEVKPNGEKKVFHAIYLAVWRLEGEAWRFLSLQAAFKK